MQSASQFSDCSLQKHPRRNNKDSDEGGGDPNSLVLVSVNRAKTRVEVHIRGPFVAPNVVSSQIATIYELAETYDTVLIYINSPGGCVDTLAEMLSAFAQYKTVITVACGQVASAGFFLWCSGHIRVVQKYTVLMAHRESYQFAGKTQQHVEFGNFTEKLCGAMIQDLCGEVLTSDEMDTIRLTEVFLSDKDMIDRGFAITWKQFMEKDSITLNVYSGTTIDGVHYTLEGDTAINDDGQVYLLNELMYDVPNKQVIGNVEFSVDTE